MEIHAYPEIYLSNAMVTMGTMLDYAVNYRHEQIDYFFQSFINLGFAYQFEIGNPDVIAGKSGVELYRMVKCDSSSYMPPYYSDSRTPQFWLGWSLAYYQWFTNRSYREIVEEVKLSELLLLYPTLHEADISRFVDEVESYFQKKKSNLQRLRERSGLSQAQLASLSGVSVRSIQMYEQKKNDISKAQFNIISSLCRALGCSAAELMDNGLAQYNMGTNISPLQMQLARNIEERNQQIAQLQEERRKTEEELNRISYNYYSQFPFQNVQGAPGAYTMPRQQFTNNWNQYWYNQVPYNAPLSQNQRNALEKAAKVVVGESLHRFGNPYAAVLFDGYCLLTADNLIEAVSSAMKVVESVQKVKQTRELNQ